MQCNSTRFTTGTFLNFLGFITNYPACRPAACKKFQQSQLGYCQIIVVDEIVVHCCDYMATLATLNVIPQVTINLQVTINANLHTSLLLHFKRLFRR